MGKKYIKKYYYKKGRWSPNIYSIVSGGLTAGENYFFVSQELAKNPQQDSSTISQQYTVKNVELNFEISAQNNANLNSICVYIMYAPQGMQVGINYAVEHPEYIMAYRYLGTPNLSSSTQPGRNAIKVKSRLSRRLQTGDRLILFVSGWNYTGESKMIYLSGLFRWWTKAN